jgi:hypothetical protein
MKPSELSIAEYCLVRALLVLAVLAVTGCDEKPAAKPIAPMPAATLVPAFEPGPKPNRSSADDLSRIDEAMKISDVEFLLRAGTSEAEVLNEVAARGFVSQLTVAEAHTLSAHGASARLITLIQDRQYVLTPPELTAYNTRAELRKQKGVPARPNDPKQREKEFEERQRQIHGQSAAPSGGQVAVRP